MQGSIFSNYITPFVMRSLTVGYMAMFMLLEYYFLKKVDLMRKRSKSHIVQKDNSFYYVTTGLIIGWLMNLKIWWSNTKWLTFSISGPMQVLGLILGYASVYLFYEVNMNLGENWIVHVGKVSNQKLVKTGPYKYVRHPMYTCFIMLLTASFLNAPYMGSLINLILGLTMIAYRVPAEDAIMRETFGKEHEAYTRQTFAVFPPIY